MVEAALIDFRTPELVLQANRVEQCLRAGWQAGQPQIRRRWLFQPQI